MAYSARNLNCVSFELSILFPPQIPCPAAVLIVCGLRRDELVRLTVEHIQKRSRRWLIADVQGKGNRLAHASAILFFNGLPTYCHTIPFFAPWRISVDCDENVIGS